MGNKVRLLPYLLRTGLFRDSNEVLRLMSAGKVKVDGKVVNSPKYQFRPSTKGVEVNGKLVYSELEKLYILFYKPLGVICQKNDQQGRTDIWQYLSKHSDLSNAEINSLVSVGRLDINSEGLLILTNDGDLVNKINQPKFDVKKEYLVTLDYFLDDENINKLKDGISISIKEDGERKRFTTLPSDIQVLSRDKFKTQLFIRISEGKKRQVRQMFLSLGFNVISLKRTKIGNLDLSNLKIGAYKKISLDEIKSKILNLNSYSEQGGD